jgi:hypothetical protein
MVPSMVAISCIPQMAMTAEKKRRDGRHVEEVLLGGLAAVLGAGAGGI